MSRLRRWLRWALYAFIGAALLGAIALGTLYYLIVPKLPDVETLRTIELQEPMYVYARDGRLMAMFGETRRYPVAIEDVPDRLKNAFIAIEDSRFYTHHGIDYKGIARAVWLLATTDDKRVPGGSTITQQVARQYFLSSEYSYKRKLGEMLLAMRMEQELSKDEIFELYLNKSFFGNRAYGVGAAAEFYYGKKMNELSLDEMASLAGIPKFPSSGNPLNNPDRAKIRRDYILDRMAEQNFVTRAEADAAKAVAMHATPHERPVEVYAPYVAEMVRQEMVARYGAEALTKGYHVTTTIEPELQIAADKAIRDGLSVYDRRHGWHGVEQHFDLAPSEDATAARVRLRGIPAQANLLLNLGEKQGFLGRSPGSLLKRGDLARIAKLETAAAEPKPGETAAPPTVSYRLDQLPQAQAALVSLEPSNGALRALSGGYSFAGAKFNRATQARRQPGSSFKPFVYAASFERGYNPASIVLDAPVVFKDRRGHIWRPQNDSGNFAGPMRVREAMVQSRNLVSVRLLDAIGGFLSRPFNWSADVSKLQGPVMLVYGDSDLFRPESEIAFFQLLGGGKRDGGWQREGVSNNRLAILPGVTHYEIASSPLLAQTLAPFLAEAIERGASAPQAAPSPSK